MDKLYQCFASTLDPNPNARKAAELELRELETQPGMLPSAFSLLSSPETTPEVRQAAAIYVKNRIRRAWNPDFIVGSTRSGIPEQDHEAIRQTLLPTLLNCPNQQIRVHVAAALGAVVRCDFPSKWPSLVDEIKALLGDGSGGDSNRIAAGLLALLEVVRGYRWKDEDNIMSPVANSTFPVLLTISNNLLSSPSSSAPEVGQLLYLVAKIFKTSITQQLVDYHQADQNIVPWGQLLLAIVQKEIDPSQLPADEDARQTSPWWKAKKWAYFSLNKLFSRFGNPTQLPSNLSKYKPFAQRFVTTFAPEILKVYLGQSEAKVQGRLWMSDRAIHLVLAFFTECIKPNSTWLLLKPNVLPLVQSFAFPLLCRTQADDEAWDLDPTDFLRQQMDPFDDFGSPRSSAATFVQTVAKKRTKTSFLPILEFVTSVLNEYPASRSAAEKEGALYTVKTLDDVMLSHPMVKTNLESFMVQHVIPELSGQDRFLKFRAAEVISRFTIDMEWKNSASLESAFQSIMACLGDPELPVRVQAAQAVTNLLDHDEVKDAMRPNAPRLMQELLNLSDEVELDVLTEPKTRVMDAFPEELLPFSTKLCEQLAQSYLRLVGAGIEAAKAIEEAGEVGREMNLSQIEEQGEEDKMFAAMSCLTTIWQVIDTAASHAETLDQLEKIVVPIVSYTIREKVYEMFDDCFELTDLLTYSQKRINDGMWDIFRLMYEAMKTEESQDYLSEMLPTLDNIISYGKDAFEANADLRNMVLDIYNTVMSGGDNFQTSERIAACKLADVLLLVLKTGLDDAIPGFLGSMLPLIGRKKEATLRQWSIVVVADCLCYNAQLTLSTLESMQATSTYFQNLLQVLPKLSKVHEKKVVAVALLSILSLDQSSLPASVSQGGGAQSLLVGLIQNLEGIPKAIEKMKEYNEELFEDEDGDETGDASLDVNLDAGDEDVVDEDNEYLELLAKEAARMRSQSAKLAAGGDGDDDDADGADDDDDDDDYDEDGDSFESPLAAVPVFDGFRKVLSSSAFVQSLAQSLSQKDQELLQAVSQIQDEDLSKAANSGNSKEPPSLPTF